MTTYLKKYLLLMCVISSCSVLFAMDNQHSTEQAPDAFNAQSATTEVFTNPNILTNIFQHLEGPDFCHLAQVSRACGAATHLNHFIKARIIADALSNRENTPIRYFCSREQGQPTFTICNVSCNSQCLLQLLKEKENLIEESIVDFDEPTYLCRTDRPGIVTSPAIAQTFSPAELEALKPLKYLEINYQLGVVEDQVVAQVRDIATQFPNCLIALEISRNDDGMPGLITESLINKLIPYPIISLSCDRQFFPTGLACLSVLRKLRGLSITECALFGDKTIPDCLCSNLPLLTVLHVVSSGLTALSPLLATLKHLVALDISDNNFTELPSSLHNLQKLKVLNLWQEDPLSREEVLNCLPPTERLRELGLPNTGYDSDPLPVESNLEQLRSLELFNTIAPLVRHKQQLKKLKSVRFVMENVPFELPALTAELPALTKISGALPDDAIISYQTLLDIAYQVEYCDLFTGNTNNNDTDDGYNTITDLTRVAELWQLIQQNKESISVMLNMIDHDNQSLYCQVYKKHIDTIRRLMQPTIKVGAIQDLTADDSNKVDFYLKFIRETFASYFHYASH